MMFEMKEKKLIYPSSMVRINNWKNGRPTKIYQLPLIYHRSPQLRICRLIYLSFVCHQLLDHVTNFNFMTSYSTQLCFAPKEQKRKKKAGPAHLQCVNVRYDGYGPDRAPVPLQKISWIKSFPGYLPSQVISRYCYIETLV
jgi:hypothetical protein